MFYWIFHSFKGSYRLLFICLLTSMCAKCIVLYDQATTVVKSTKKQTIAENYCIERYAL